jgi:hypothetical protein
MTTFLDSYGHPLKFCRVYHIVKSSDNLVLKKGSLCYVSHGPGEDYIHIRHESGSGLVLGKELAQDAVRGLSPASDEDIRSRIQEHKHRAALLLNWLKCPKG